MDIQAGPATDNRGPRITAIIVTLTSISSLFVSLRLYTRAVIKKALYPEDYVIVLALLMSWGEVGFYIAAVRYGLGRHMRDLTPEESQDAQQLCIFGTISGIFGLGLPRIALAMMLNRILLANYWTSMVSWFLSITSMVNFTVSNLMILFQCTTPKQAVWVHDPEAKCFNVWLAAWPALVVFRLNMNRTKSIGLSCVLGLGTVACGVAGYKATLLPLLANPDILYESEGLVMWKVAEATALLVGSSIPFLTPICRIFLMWFKGVKARAGDFDMDSVPDLVHNLGHERRLHRRGGYTGSGIVLRHAPRQRHGSI
ncbi:hypothetical protein MCOR25_010295 [Pyricularia grisea]|uniref:Rhodopsin domain-containing protein n=1 Tax=Pyricularia grisea TaxID=148305 RepID=A0A6P8AWY8_PYRGI|nr:uncharacterized protein PgNI_08460 [Pyricularia grisea]KAI6350912.1 hypothetical protein MCOR25_010295 [Pyricularia grisea]TLD06707.1 hypothetical protein PgNI_08460 [Pyricularia grisea]